MVAASGRKLARIRPGVRPIDVTLALALAAVGGAEVGLGLVRYPGPPVLTAAMVAGSTLPIAFRRVAPLPMLAVMAAASVPYLARFGAVNNFGPMLALLVAAYSVGRYAARQTAVIGAVAIGSLVAVQGLTATGEWGAGDWLFVGIIFGGTLLLGHALGAQARRAEVLTGEAERLRLDRERAIEGAVDEERARIARELHDIVAHNVGLMVLQAGGGRSVMATEPRRAHDALLTIETTGRQTLLEMRRLVGILRGAAEAGERDPLPGLSQLDGLFEEVRAAGLEVEVETEGPLATLDPGLDLAVFRIVQQALTNVQEHAGASRVQVALRCSGGTVELRIADDGHGRAAMSTADSVGHGLIGMRERALLYGGAFTAGDRPGGGFEVRATLPTAPADR